MGLGQAATENEYRGTFTRFTGALKQVEQRKRLADEALLAPIGQDVEDLTKLLVLLNGLDERIAELRRGAARPAALRTAQADIARRTSQLRARVQRRARYVHLCPELANYWTEERQTKLAAAVEDGEEAARLLGVARKAYKPDLPPTDPSARPIEDVLLELGRTVPDEEWDRLIAAPNYRR
jgi:hypothetical protein